MKNKTLVVMAAGMGSRFGGLKQITPFGPNGEFLIDYSIYDAIRVGFTRVIFIIKRENYEIFRETIGSRVENFIDVEYVFQEFYSELTKDRVKPLGTGQAILCCKDVINEDFITINADDFYGYDAFKKASEFLDNNENGEYAVINYRVSNTLGNNGLVKRGLCNEVNGYLTGITECSIGREKNYILAESLKDKKSFIVLEDAKVSMNMFAFKSDFLTLLKDGFEEFLEKNKNDLKSCEYLLPDVVEMAIENGKRVRCVETDSKWYGVTYKEDSEIVRNAIAQMISDGVYPKDLWKK